MHRKGIYLCRVCQIDAVETSATSDEALSSLSSFVQVASYRYGLTQGNE